MGRNEVPPSLRHTILEHLRGQPLNVDQSRGSDLKVNLREGLWRSGHK